MYKARDENRVSESNNAPKIRGGEALVKKQHHDPIVQRTSWVKKGGKLYDTANPDNEMDVDASTPTMNDGDVWDDQTNKVTPKKTEQIQTSDPIVEAVIDQDYDGVKKDVDTAMTKIKVFLLKESITSIEIAKALKTSGRDWFVYAPFVSWFKDLGGLMASWNSSWTIEQTTGLLIDLSIAVNKIVEKKIPDQVLLMNDFMSGSRQKDKRVNKDSEWVQSLPPGSATQAGVSASTGNVLKLLRAINGISSKETEALMNGLYFYWNNAGSNPSLGSKLKQYLGDFHTASEIWAAYMYSVEQYSINPPIRSKL